jgi:deoxyribodipyrimidine photo-lyase
VVIWWVRRDLRLSDNPAWQAALAQDDRVIPLFILDPHLLRAPAEKRQAFLFAGLRQLDVGLRARGSRLIVRQGEPLDMLRALMAETGARAVYAEEDYSPYAQKRDAAIACALPLQLELGVTVQPPQTVLKSDGKPYTVFTPFSRAWRALSLPGVQSLLPAPESLAPAPDLVSLNLPQVELPAGFPPGEEEAQRRLEAFADGSIFEYGDGRNRLDLDGTSALSPYLRFGMLSARQAVVTARWAAETAPDAASRKGAEA